MLAAPAAAEMDAAGEGRWPEVQRCHLLHCPHTPYIAIRSGLCTLKAALASFAEVRPPHTYTLACWTASAPVNRQAWPQGLPLLLLLRPVLPAAPPHQPLSPFCCRADFDGPPPPRGGGGFEPPGRGGGRPPLRDRVVGGDLAYHASHGVAALLEAPLPPGAPADALTHLLARRSRAELYDYLAQMQGLLQRNPTQARQILADNPQLTKALFQMQARAGAGRARGGGWDLRELERA